MKYELNCRSLTRKGWNPLALAALLAISPVLAEAGSKPTKSGPQPKHHCENPHERPAFHASEIVEDFYEKLGQGDLPGLMEHFADDAKWVLYGPTEIPFAGVHEGKDGIQAFIESFGKNAKVTRFEPKEFLSDKSKVVVHGYEEAIAVPTGKSWKAHWTHSFTVKRGRIVLVEEVLDTAPVLAAFQP